MKIREVAGKRAVKLMIDGRLADGTRFREKAASYRPGDREGTAAAYAKADKLIKEWEPRIALGIFTPPSAAKRAAVSAPAVEVSVEDYIARFLASPRATAEHKMRLRPFVALWKARPVRSITKADVKLWIDTRMQAGVMHSTIRKDASALSTLFEDAIQSSVIDANPVRMVKLPKNDTEPGVAYEPAEVEKILAAVPADLGRVLRALALTGARRKEVVSLTWADYREAEGVLRLRRYKTSSTTEFPVEGELGELLADCRRAPVVNKTYIFADDDGVPWVTAARGQTITDRVKRALARLGISRPHLTPLHSFRHFFATQAVRRGVPIERLSYLLGHASLTMTQRYFRVTAEDCREAVRGHSLGTAIPTRKLSH